MTTIQLLAQVRKLTKTGTLYAAAKKLEIPLSTVQHWDKGKGRPSPYNALRFAEVLNLPLEYVLATIEAEKETDPDKRQAWSDLLRKYKRSALSDGSIPTGSTGGRPLLLPLQEDGPEEQTAAGQGGGVKRSRIIGRKSRRTPRGESRHRHQNGSKSRIRRGFPENRDGASL